MFSTHHSSNPSNTSPSTFSTLSSLINPQSAQGLKLLTPPSPTPTLLTTIPSLISGTRNPSSLSVPIAPFFTSATSPLNLPTSPCHALITSATSLSSRCISAR